MISPVEYIRQIRREAGKITWPKRKEVVITTIMVCIMAALAAVFFLIVDQVLSYIIKLILSLGA
ncbi:MAG: preprotein translocase subunit SecE [Rickettsiales bacterium]|jgi:preprotein translocase subunit SecE|nr:preprotein translocase subunit SecE [Rickettsiales bacterium]|tara:strand:- start:72225 stop:72416 length:192 start_codon:yes stop_codon:yes gene_type:complete